MRESIATNHTAVQDLCLACGHCCNGVIFADVKLQTGDDPARLRALGLAISARPGGSLNDLDHRKRKESRFLQPCVALAGCRCRIYPDRPRYCREFECLLLRNVKEDRIPPGAALTVIREAREKADRVLDLLRGLGDTDEALSIRTRFQSVQARLEKGGGSPQLYGDLTVVMHELNLVIAESFYPG